VAVDIKSRHMDVGRDRGTVLRRVLRMDRVTNAVRRIVGIKRKCDKAAGKSRIVVELREDLFKVDVGRECLVALVQNVKIAVQVVDKEARRRQRRVRRLRAQKVYAPQLAPVVDRWRIAVPGSARERQTRVVLEQYGRAVFVDLGPGRILGSCGAATDGQAGQQQAAQHRPKTPREKVTS